MVLLHPERVAAAWLRSGVPWLAPLHGAKAQPAATYPGDATKAIWLPNAAVARAWEHCVRDTVVPDPTPPPAPSNLRMNGRTLTRDAEADLESGLAGFVSAHSCHVIAVSTAGVRSWW